MKGAPMIPTGGNDDVMTPHELARRIVEYFCPYGLTLDPCAGLGAFSSVMPNCLAWEINPSFTNFPRDFLFNTYKYRAFDWIITNPPWSKLRAFLRESMRVSDNVVFLTTLNHMLALKARFRDIEEAGFGFKEILLVDTPPPPWPPSGFQLGAVHVKRRWRGKLTMSKL